MWTIGTLFSAFQLEAITGLEPGNAELSDHSLERKWPSRATRTNLSSCSFTRRRGERLGAV